MSYDQLKVDVEEHGEVHAILLDDLEDERELEIRKGQVTWDHYGETENSGAFTLTDEYGTIHTFWYDQIVHWYKPRGIWH